MPTITPEIQAALNKEADVLFATATGISRKLDPKAPADQKWIPIWLTWYATAKTNFERDAITWMHTHPAVASAHATAQAAQHAQIATNPAAAAAHDSAAYQAATAPAAGPPPSARPINPYPATAAPNGAGDFVQRIEDDAKHAAERLKHEAATELARARALIQAAELARATAAASAAQAVAQPANPAAQAQAQQTAAAADQLAGAANTQAGVAQSVTDQAQVAHDGLHNGGPTTGEIVVGAVVVGALAGGAYLLSRADKRSRRAGARK